MRQTKDKYLNTIQQTNNKRNRYSEREREMEREKTVYTHKKETVRLSSS